MEDHLLSHRPPPARAGAEDLFRIDHRRPGPGWKVHRRPVSTTGRRGINIPKYHANQNHGNSHPLGWMPPIWGKTTFMVVPRKSHPSRGWMPPMWGKTTFMVVLRKIPPLGVGCPPCGGRPPLWWYRTKATYMIHARSPHSVGGDAWPQPTSGGW